MNYHTFGPVLEVEMSKECTPLWREAHFQVKMVKSIPCSEHWDAERVHIDAKHISKSKCIKHTIPEALLEVEMSKKCTPLWREAPFHVKMVRSSTCTDHF